MQKSVLKVFFALGIVVEILFLLLRFPSKSSGYLKKRLKRKARPKGQRPTITF